MVLVASKADEVAGPSCRTTELSDAGGPAHPHSQLTPPARVRSSDFVRHGLFPSVWQLAVVVF
jgi:hypothetical protein